MNVLKPGKKESLFARVRKNIKPVRKQGDMPEEDIEAMEGYVCDLCLGSVKRAGMVQCPFCGRWVCKQSCYSDEELSCISCAGVIKLMRESVVLDDLASIESDRPVDEKKKEK